MLARLAAAGIAAIAWVGLAVDFAASAGRTGSALVSLWALLRFFTITTNLAVAVVFSAFAAGASRAAAPRLLAGLTLSIVLVGAVFRLLLEGLTPHGLGLGNILLHRATPILVPCFWLGFVPHGRLRIADPLVWLLYPLGYLGYALGRGALDGRYPYPFLDVPRIGWDRMAVNALAIGGSFVVTGLFAVALDRMLGRRARRREAAWHTTPPKIPSPTPPP